MAERTSTHQARRAVAQLIERYFRELRRQLGEQTEAFWMRVESSFAAKAREEEIHDQARQRSDPHEVVPAAGPHAKPELTDYDKTPGAGTLPSPNDKKVDTGTG